MRSVLLLALAACSSDVAVDLTIDADPCMVDLTDRLVVTVFDESGAEVESFERTEEDGLAFPTGVRILSSDAERRWRVEVTALATGDLPIGFQQAEGDFDGDVTSRAVLLDDRCLGIECSEGTCIAGACSDVTFDSVTPNPAPAQCPGLAFADAASGSGAPCGTVTDPCSDAEEALGTLPGGGILYLHGGEPFRSGTALSIDVGSVVLRPWPDTGRPIIDADGAGVAVDVNAPDVVVDGLEIRNAARHGVSINGAVNERVVVRNCEIHSNGDSESMFDNHAAVMLNNGANDVIIENNVLRDNVTMLDRRCSGVHANGSSGVIRNNRIEGNSRTGIYANNGQVDVIDNVLVDNGSLGISVDAVGEVRGNRVCRHPEGMLVRTDVALTFNTIVDSEGAAIRFANGSAAVTTRNILAFNGIGLEAAAGSDPMDGPNLYFMNAMRFEGVTPDMESADVIADPLFVTRDDCSLALADGSPARGATPEESFGATR